MDKKKTLVYICHPFRAKDIRGIQENIEKAIGYGKWAERQGLIPLIPHINSAALFGRVNEDEEDDRIIVEYDLELLRRCDRMFVCGERVSKGMQTEIDFCKDHNIEVTHVGNIDI